MKIRAYTLMEVTVAMLLSAICITICYTAYGIITNYYSSFQQKNQKADVVLTLSHVMENDFLKSKIILKNENGIELERDSTKINYVFNEQNILRKLNEEHTDTFKLEVKNLEFSFEGHGISETDTVDQVKFTSTLDKGIVTPLQFNKLYSAQNLFN